MSLKKYIITKHYYCIYNSVENTQSTKIPKITPPVDTSKIHITKNITHNSYNVHDLYNDDYKLTPKHEDNINGVYVYYSPNYDNGKIASFAIYFENTYNCYYFNIMYEVLWNMIFVYRNDQLQIYYYGASRDLEVLYTITIGGKYNKYGCVLYANLSSYKNPTLASFIIDNDNPYIYLYSSAYDLLNKYITIWKNDLNTGYRIGNHIISYLINRPHLTMGYLQPMQVHGKILLYKNNMLITVIYEYDYTTLKPFMNIRFVFI